MEIIRQNRLIAAVLGGLVVMSVLVLLFNDDPAPRFVPPTAGPSTPTPTRAVATPQFERPDIGPLECRRLLTRNAIDLALGIDDRPAGQRNTTGLSRGETCTEELASDANTFIQIQPGGPSDFEPTTRLLEVAGQPVPGVGDAARWFGGPDSSTAGDAGALVVRAATDLGDLYYRIVLGRPDLPEAEQRALAVAVAGSALPRFPGVVIELPPTPPDEDLAAALDEPGDPVPPLDLVDDLLAREAAGEWTRGEGLIEALRYLEDRSGDFAVTAAGTAAEGTGVIKLAIAHLADPGLDPAVAEELQTLLDQRIWTNEELEAMAGITLPEDEDLARAPAPGQLIALDTTRPAASRATAHLAQPVDLCGNMFHGAIKPGVGTCLEWRPANVPGPGLAEDKYRVFIPSKDLPQGGWTEDDFDLALGALEFSARWFEANGNMPPVNLIFSVSPGSRALAEAAPVPGQACGVVLFRSLQTESDANFQQTIAHELAHCFQTENFPAQDIYPTSKWREEGLAEYLSNLVYPQNNFEWESFTEIGKIRRTNTIFDFAYANGLFFQHLERDLGLAGIFSLVRRLPTEGGRAEQEAALATVPGIDTMFLEYAEALIDGDIRDSGGGTVPAKIEYSTNVLTGPASKDLEFEPFGIGRIRFEVEECKLAVFSFEWKEVRDTARPELDDEWAPHPDRLGVEDDDDRVLAITATTKQQAKLTIIDVRDDPECDEDDGGYDAPPVCPLDCPPSEFYWRAFGVSPE